MSLNTSSDHLQPGTVIYQSSSPRTEYVLSTKLKSDNNLVYRIKIKDGTAAEKDAVAKWTNHNEGSDNKTTREWAIDREIEILTKLDQFHRPGIVQILSIPPNSTGNKAHYWAESHLAQVGKFFVTEYLPHNSLSHWYKKKNYQKDFVWVIGCLEVVLSALAVAHGQEIVHLDIKPSNILFRSLDKEGKPREPVLIDWGGARYLADDLKGQQYSEGYSAPERKTALSPDPKMDVWALGGILYAMLTGQTPSAADLNLSEKIQVGNSATLRGVQNLVRDMRLVEPTDRISIAEIQKRLVTLKELAKRESYVPQPTTRFKGLWAFVTLSLLVVFVAWGGSTALPTSLPVTAVPTLVATTSPRPTPTITVATSVVASPTDNLQIITTSEPTPALAPPLLKVVSGTSTLEDCYLMKYADDDSSDEDCNDKDIANLFLCSQKTYSGKFEVFGTAIIPTPMPQFTETPNAYKFEYKVKDAPTWNQVPGTESTNSVNSGYLATIDSSLLDVPSNVSFGFRLAVKKSDGNIYQCAIWLKISK